jgi:hypothetical protein
MQDSDLGHYQREKPGSGSATLRKYCPLNHSIELCRWEEDTYTDRDGTEHNNSCELVWEVSLVR